MLRALILIGAASCAMAGSPPPVSVIDLGIGAIAVDVWSDGHGLVRIVGTNRTGSDTPMLWTLDPQGVLTPTPLPNQVGTYGGSNNYAGGISANGQWICGASTIAIDEFQAEGTIWNVDDVLNPIGAGPGTTGTFSELYGVANDGTAIGFDGLLPLVKRPGQAPFSLPIDPTVGFGWGTSISADGVVMVGFYNTAAFRRARVWLNDGETFYDLEDPEGVYSEAGNISPNGSRVSGVVFLPSEGILIPCGWTDDGILFPPHPDHGGYISGVCYDVSDDGMWVGIMEEIPTPSGQTASGWVWHESWPHARRFSDWTNESACIELEHDVLEVYSVFHDGESYHFTFLSDDDPVWGGGMDYARTHDVNACPADLVEPFGLLDLADITTFSEAFVAGDLLADLAPPCGLLDLADINAFVDSFLVGCQ